MGRQIQITLRVPEEWVERIDKIATAIARPGLEASRADALRLVLSLGLEPAEAQTRHTAADVEDPPMATDVRRKAEDWLPAAPARPPTGRRG